MFAIFYRRRLGFPPKYCILGDHQLWPPQNAVLVKSFCSSVCKNVSEKSFTVSYLINSCGLSSKDAIAVSKKLSFKSPEKPDAVLELFRKYGFTNADISSLIIRWPLVLLACPNKNLLPKLEFFRSIGVPLPVLAQKLSLHPSVLTRSLENSLIPLYNDMKSILQSDEGVVRVFSRVPNAFGRCWSEGINSNISMLRERGVPESSIVYMVMRKPSLLVVNERLAVYVDRAVEMGFDISKHGFVHAIEVFIDLGESNLKHKMEVYRRCGWSEPDIIGAFLRYPNCMNISEEKIMANMDFLVNKLGCKPAAIAQCPRLLGLSHEKRIKPRCLVARILNEKGLKNMTSAVTLLTLAEKEFLRKYIVKYEKDIPELLDIYLQRKVEPPEMCFSQEVSA